MYISVGTVLFSMFMLWDAYNRFIVRDPIFVFSVIVGVVFGVIGFVSLIENFQSSFQIKEFFNKLFNKTKESRDFSKRLMAVEESIKKIKANIKRKELEEELIETEKKFPVGSIAMVETPTGIGCDYEEIKISGYEIDDDTLWACTCKGTYIDHHYARYLKKKKKK